MTLQMINLLLYRQGTHFVSGQLLCKCLHVSNESCAPQLAPFFSRVTGKLWQLTRMSRCKSPPSFVTFISCFMKLSSAPVFVSQSTQCTQSANPALCLHFSFLFLPLLETTNVLRGTREMNGKQKGERRKRRVKKTYSDEASNLIPDTLARNISNFSTYFLVGIEIQGHPAKKKVTEMRKQARKRKKMKLENQPIVITLNNLSRGFLH